MATIPMCNQPQRCLPTVREANSACEPCTLHRIAEVRSQQGISLRAVSRKTGIDVRDLKRQEKSSTDLTLTELYQWQMALDVPVENLLLDHDEELSAPIQSRAAMVKVMKTVVAITEVASSCRVQRLATMLREQLVEMMPELAEIGGWPNYGTRRPPDQQGRIGENPIDVRQLRLD
ncbi:MAG: helix-turn-helix transcriptional regulator [Pirellula sp.]